MDNKLKETYTKTHYAGEILDELYDKDIVEAKEILLYTLQQLELSEMAGCRYKYVEELMEEFDRSREKVERFIREVQDPDAT